MKVLVLTVGLPRSGKSTWASQQGCPVVCPDQIRLALHGREFYPPAEPMVWYVAQVMVRALFGSGHEKVILDACNVTEKRRREWLSPQWKTTFKLFDTDPEVCRQRARAACNSDLLIAIDRMIEEWEQPSSEEMRL